MDASIHRALAYFEQPQKLQLNILYQPIHPVAVITKQNSDQATMTKDIINHNDTSASGNHGRDDRPFFAMQQDQQHHTDTQRQSWSPPQLLAHQQTMSLDLLLARGVLLATGAGAATSAATAQHGHREDPTASVPILLATTAKARAGNAVLHRPTTVAAAASRKSELMEIVDSVMDILGDDGADFDVDDTELFFGAI
mmetsp:Transcript_28093/g.78779  ORF Transcript_28093/g.78779 Transcript_28093/m.78779 type:complete len:197 (-) Transcript_28093:93-683(-)